MKTGRYITPCRSWGRQAGRTRSSIIASPWSRTSSVILSSTLPARIKTAMDIGGATPRPLMPERLAPGAHSTILRFAKCALTFYSIALSGRKTAYTFPESALGPVEIQDFHKAQDLNSSSPRNFRWFASRPLAAGAGSSEIASGQQASGTKRLRLSTKGRADGPDRPVPGGSRGAGGAARSGAGAPEGFRAPPPRQWGACWLALDLWEQFSLDAFWQGHLPPAAREPRG